MPEEMKQAAQKACTFQRGTWECRGDGYLWDADSDGWDPNESDNPCPCCNTLEYLELAKEEAEGCSSWSNCGSSGTGEDIWLNCLQWAEEANPEGIEEILKQIGPVEALVADPSSPGGYFVRTNNAEVQP
ncbi:hypothetical protein QEM15_003175 [Pseudomonas putida]|nr:hypothetical protein [Pseudomonas putida]